MVSAETEDTRTRTITVPLSLFTYPPRLGLSVELLKQTIKSLKYVM